MKKLHLGCGSIRLDGWLNIDLESEDADLELDLREPLPFDDESVDFIYSEHMLEHLTQSDGLRLLAECRRVLKPEGVFRVSTPDLLWLTLVYHSQLTSTWGQLWHPQSPCQLMNEGMRSWGHLFLYDRRELVSALLSSGFTDVVDQEWRESQHPELNGLESRPFHNDLILEASKLVVANGVSVTSTINDELLPQIATLSEPLILAQAEHIRSLRDRINVVETERNETARNFGDMSASINGLSDRLEAVRQHVEDLTRIERQSSLENESIRQLLEAKSQDYEGKLDASKAEMESAIADFAGKLDASRVELESTIANFGERLEDSQIEKLALEQAKSDCLKKVSRLESERQELLDQILAVRSELRSSVENQRAMAGLLAAAAVTAQGQEREISGLGAIQANLETELERRSSLIQALRNSRVGRFAIWTISRSSQGISP